MILKIKYLLLWCIVMADMENWAGLRLFGNWLDPTVRHFGFRADWYDGPIWSFGFWWFHFYVASP